MAHADFAPCPGDMNRNERIARRRAEVSGRKGATQSLDPARDLPTEDTPSGRMPPCNSASQNGSDVLISGLDLELHKDVFQA